MALNNWQKSIFGNRKKKIELLRCRLKELMWLSTTPQFLEEHAVLSSKLESLVEEEKLYWKQRSKVMWLTKDDSLLFGKASRKECESIQSVLNDYAVASGQRVNFDKRSIVFSKGVELDVHNCLASIMGVNIVEKYDKDLGLPTVVGRNKMATFDYIKEQLSNKLEGWQRLYRARYCPNDNFWSASVDTKTSVCWKSIFEARDLLVNGTRWQIGDGASVHACEDPWLPRPRLSSTEPVKQSVFPGAGRGGIGVVIRNSDAQVVGGCCLRIENVNALNLVEAIARRIACERAGEFDLASLVMESDCLALVNGTKSTEIEDSDFGTIVEDIKVSLSNLPSSFFTHVYRESNTTTHKLAKLALTVGINVRWSVVPLLFFKAFVPLSVTLDLYSQ
ncbi:hypothetical protein ACLB2K_035650 [Fragaria x ananassa]